MAIEDSLRALDEGVLRAAVAAPNALVIVCVVASLIGGGWALLALLPFALRRSTRPATFSLLAAIAVTSGVVSALKALVGRVRPCDALPWCVAHVPSPGGASFPSGHAAGSFAFAAFVCVRAPRLAPIALAYAALVASSRCVLGVHYPTDVLAGTLLGASIGAMFAWLGRARFEPRAASPSAPIPPA